MNRLKARAKIVIAESFERFGLTVTGYGHANCLRQLLKAEGIDMTIDVGANAGQYGRWLRKVVGFSGTILSVEPVSDSHARLRERAAGDGRWIVPPACALGRESGSTVVQVARNSVSSSVLPTSALGLTAMADAVDTVREETVPVHTLEELRNEHIKPGQRAFLKVDTQGFEREVMAGIGGNFDLWPIVQLELSTVPMYSGEASLSEMLVYMESLGYQLYSVFPSYWARPSYRMHQADCLFLHQSAQREA